MKYTSEQKKFIEDNFYKYTLPELTMVFNEYFKERRTVNGISQYCSKVGFIKNRHFYSKEENQWLKEHIMDGTFKTLTDMFNAEFGCELGENAIKVHCKVIGVSHGRRYDAFTPEQDAWLIKNVPNGKWDAIKIAFEKEFGVSKEITAFKTHCNRHLKVYVNGGKTGYHAGCVVWNDMPDGTERVLNSGYTYIKQGGEWIPKQKYIYEQANGKLKGGQFVVFADSNKANFELSNLVVVDRKIHAKMCSNGWYDGNPTVCKTGVKLCELEIAMEVAE